MTLEKLPPVLVLHLKRFVYEKTGGCQKLVKSVEYPVDLEISRGDTRGGGAARRSVRPGVHGLGTWHVCEVSGVREFSFVTVDFKFLDV